MRRVSRRVAGVATLCLAAFISLLGAASDSAADDAAAAQCSMNAAGNPDAVPAAPAGFRPPRAGPAPTRSQNFPPALAAPQGYSPISRSAAITYAVSSAAQSDSVNVDTDVVATLMPYAEAMAATGMAVDPRIAAGRCVWMVQVTAPFIVRAPGRTRKPFADRYTVVIDANTGFPIGLITGPKS